MADDKRTIYNVSPIPLIIHHNMLWAAAEYNQCIRHKICLPLLVHLHKSIVKRQTMAILFKML